MKARTFINNDEFSSAGKIVALEMQTIDKIKAVEGDIK